MHRVYLQAHVGAGPLSSIMVAAHNKHRASCNRLAGRSTGPPTMGPAITTARTNTQRGQDIENPSQPAIPSQFLKNIEWEIYRHGGPTTGSLT